MRTPRLLAVDWTDPPADLNGLVRLGERRNLVSARVPSDFKRTLQTRFHVCIISGFRHSVGEISAIPGCLLRGLAVNYRHFRTTYRFPNSRVKHLDLWRWKRNFDPKLWLLNTNLRRHHQGRANITGLSLLESDETSFPKKLPTFPRYLLGCW